MKRIAVWLLMTTMLLIGVEGLTGCSERRPATSEVEENDSTLTDSTTTGAEDSEEELISDTPMPKAAEEYFDDFFFNFAANRKLQLARVKFPLTVVDGDTRTTMSRGQWKMDNFFLRQGFYTQIFDNQRQADEAKEPTVSHVVLERIHLAEDRVERFFFDRQKAGVWMLTELRKEGMEQNVNASFLSFYSRFVGDSAFQVQSLDDRVTFSSPNPDDEFETQTGEIVPDQWPMFKPDLIPAGIIYNIVYGNQPAGSNQKIFLTRGIANGMESQMLFRKKAGRWKLVEFSN